MSYNGQTALVTGGSSGIGRALSRRLVEKGARVFIADINIEDAETFVKELNDSKSDSAFCAKCDVNSWDDLTSVFTKALTAFDGRVDYVFPVAGVTERQVIPRPSEQKDVRKEGFVKPDLRTYDTNGTGMINLVMIAVQAFRGQEPKPELGGMRGKIVLVASTCGLYAMYGVPVYTASKHAMIGLVRTYGYLLPGEDVTFNAICPHVVRTGIAKNAPTFYDDLEKDDLLTDINNVVAGFETFLGESTKSGECLEVGPRRTRTIQFMDFSDEETKKGVDATYVRSAKLWKDQAQ
ncbi:hypothetical protein LTR37_004644 [Vermiconidia calcicola]|uniref:Uncharacterized protein n=1 Tax=Vermiconidia calcicola TaxID=1690605 RepID=A0ACC3NMS8_9PEZI|nr:hypothetical protein LTR37_004644 [Vermiconidia calcicola]